jgi:hypothetical protein
MSKKKVTEKTLDSQEENHVPEELIFDSVLVGHIKLSDSKFQIVTVPIESKTLTLGKPKLGEVCGDIGEAKYEFKMAAFKNGLV